MSTRRGRRRPLADFASRSPLHSIAAWLIRTTLLVLLALFGYFVIMNLLVPNMIDGLVQQFQNTGQ